VYAALRACRCGRSDAARVLAVVVGMVPAATRMSPAGAVGVFALVAVTGVALAAAQHRRDGAVAADECRVVGVDVRQLARHAVPDHPLRRCLCEWRQRNEHILANSLRRRKRLAAMDGVVPAQRTC